jgi:hypothetical protein
MGQKRLRLRVWMLMALVAVAAVGMGGWELKKVSDAHARRAMRHAEREAIAREGQRYVEGQIRERQEREAENRKLSAQVSPEAMRAMELVNAKYRSRFEEVESSALAGFRRRADYHAALSRKYQRLARYPWLPVAPDLPEPK